MLEENENTNLKRYMHPNIQQFIYNSKIWKQPKCPPTDEWRKGGMCMYIYQRGMYVYLCVCVCVCVYSDNRILVIKNNGILPSVYTWQ